MKVRFVGSTADLGDGRTLDQFGQAIEMHAEEFTELLPRLPIIPDHEFQDCGFTPAELEQYPAIALQVDAPAEFVAKRKAAWDALHELRAALAALHSPTDNITAGEPAQGE